MTAEQEATVETVKEQKGPLKLSHENLVQHALRSEFVQVCRTPVDGVLVSQCYSNPFLWFGTVFIRKGVFGGGIFRFKLEIPTDFPDTCTLPIITFENSIFHPLIDVNAKTLDLSRSFPDGWKKEKHNMLRVLIVLQRIFFSYEFECDQCINPEAAILYKEDRDKFKSMAKTVVDTSRAEIYEPPPPPNDRNSIHFIPYDLTTHAIAREQMLLIGKGQRAESSGKSKIITTDAEYRRERAVKNNIDLADVVGKHFPKSYSWYDAEGLTVLTHENVERNVEVTSNVSTARLDREKHGIEPLDLSTISGDSPNPSPTKIQAESFGKSEEHNATNDESKI